LFTTALGYLLCLWLGYSAFSSFLIALALTFSSTIVVTKVLSDRKHLGTLYGKISVGILLVQDVLATVVLILFSASTQSNAFGPVLGYFIAKLALAVGIVFVTGTYILPRLTKSFARSQEFLMLFSVGWGMGLAALFQYVGLSMEIGALAAGISLASSPYHYEISAKMKLLRDFFIVLFFILLGSELSLDHLTLLGLPALWLSLFVLLGNPLIVFSVLTILNYHPKVGFQTGLTIGQVSEFSLLLVLLSVRNGWLPPEVLTLVTIVALFTISGSTFLMLRSDELYRKLTPYFEAIFKRPTPRSATREKFDVLIFGCHRLGTNFIDQMSNEGVNYLVVDYDPATVQELNERGIRARYGDAADNDLLDEIGIEKAKLIVSTIPDAETNFFLLEKVRRKNRTSAFIIIAHTVDEALLFYERGASYVIVPNYLGGNHAADLIERFGFEDRRYASERTRQIRRLAKRKRPEHAGIGALARP
jgi:Kef-type K+ transport system membrane component KefB/Trk K+ transport system NAD-binding subunit